MKNKHIHHVKGCGSGAVYGFGFLGALVYYFQHAISLQEGLWGILKAIFWPAFFVYKVIEMLGI